MHVDQTSDVLFSQKWTSDIQKLISHRHPLGVLVLSRFYSIKPMKIIEKSLGCLLRIA